MSGIFGILDKTGAPIEGDTLQSMQSAMVDWGRDRRGMWCDGQIGLGHLLMMATPEAQYEQQPTRHPAAPGLVLVADARIDNRDELCDALSIPADCRPTLSDDILILLAYARWGKACVARLLGDFAFAIWDQHNNELFCARDHIGARPLCFFDGPDRFVFASDVRGILAVPGLPRRIDPEALTAHYVLHYNRLKDRTFFHDILKLRPAHQLVVNDVSTRQEQYWHPQRVQPLRLPSVDDYAELFRELLEAAVACRLRSLRPIGAHLSGGLDSTAVTVLAARLLRAEGRALDMAYSWSPPPDEGELQPGDERALIELVCRRERLACSYTSLSAGDVTAFRARDISVEPVETLIHQMNVLKSAASRGVGVILSGWGGDELISSAGRGYYAELLTKGRWATLLRVSREHAAKVGGSPWKTVLTRGFLPLLPDSVYRALGRDLPGWARRLVHKTAVSWADFGPSGRRLMREQWRVGRTRPGVRANQLIALNLGHLTYRIESWAAAGASLGVEHRYPLLDRRIIELVLALPADMFIQQGWTRFLFRYTLSPFLPDQICWNPEKREPAKWNAQQRAFSLGLRQYEAQISQDDRATSDVVIAETLRSTRRLRQLHDLIASQHDVAERTTPDVVRNAKQSKS